MGSTPQRLINFVTYSGEPFVSVDDVPLARALEKRGFSVQACPWDGESPQYPFDTTFVIRSPWNYDSAPGDFLSWLEGLEQAGHRLINPYPLVKWNIYKGYLLEAARKGVAIPDTLLLPRDGSWSDVSVRMLEKHEKVVLKPAISLSAHHTYLMRASEVMDQVSSLARDGRQYMIQEFMPEIASGELSFVFFDGHFSHCVRKTPRSGDFRTQGEFGAMQERYDPTTDEIEAAVAALAIAPQKPIFARVDLVKRGSTLLLMELELIDPMLFLAWVPESVA